VGPIIRTCRLIPLAALALAPAQLAASEEKKGDLFWLAQRAELVQRDDVALKAYSDLLSSNPESAVAANRLLEAAIRNGDLAAAVRATRAAELSGAADNDAPLILLVDAWRRKKWDQVGKHIQQLEMESNFAFMAPMLRSWLAIKQGRPGTFSIEDMRKNPLTAYYGDDQLVYQDLAEGKVAQAKVKLRGFRGYGETYGRHLAINAIGAMKRGGEAEFATALEQQIGVSGHDMLAPALTPDIGLSLIFSRLASALDEQKQPAKALQFARLAQWTAASDDSGKLALADMLAAQVDKGRASTLLASIPENSPFWPEAVRKRVDLAATPAEAAALGGQAVARKPGNAQLKLLYGQMLERAGERPKAITVYRSLNEAAAGNERQQVIFHMLLASALDAEGNWPEARAELERAVEIDGNNPQALNYLGYSLLERREDIKRGFELVARAHELSPQSAAITDSLGWGHYLQGDLDKALPLLESAAQAAENDVAINEHLGDAYWKVGRKVEARYAWRAASLQAEGDAGKRLAAKIDFGWSEANAAP
jgi:Flp pilus assembly protein TadD